MTELSPLALRLRRRLATLDHHELHLAEIWACLVTEAPEVAGDPGRRRVVRRMIDELAAAGWLEVPTGRTAWTVRGEPPLPRRATLRHGRRTAGRLAATSRTRWRPELAWADDVALTDREYETLRIVDRWLRDRSRPALVPPRERSLELFGAGGRDRLAELATTRVFGPGRLTWELLACAPVPVPLVFSEVGAGRSLLVVSGHESFASIRRVLVDAQTSGVGLVAYGAADRFAAGVLSAANLDRPVERIVYYGDIAAADLHTLHRAADAARRAGLPTVEPAVVLYELLVHHGRPEPGQPVDRDEARRLAGCFDGELRATVRRLMVEGRWLPQEWVGYELLRRRLRRAGPGVVV